MRLLSLASWLALFLSTIASAAEGGDVADVPPDVIVFLMDDVAAHDIEPVETPVLDGLAAIGTTFTRAYAQPKCAPSRWSFLLSRWRGDHAGFACKNPGPTARTLPHGLDSIPKVMEGAGYSTGLFGRWAVGTNPLAEPNTEDWKFTPHLWGFETWRAGIPDGTVACIPSGGYSNWLRVDDGQVSVSNEYQTIALREAFIGWWSSTPGPRFAYVALQAAHKGGEDDAWHIPPPAAMPPGYVPPAQPSARQRYEAMIQSADYAIGRMLDHVDLTRTVVIVTADNGTPREVVPPTLPANHVKGSVFEGGVHVPFVLAGPGVPRGMRTRQLVALVDVAPSLVELVGAPRRPGRFDGQSILPALHGRRLARQWVYVQNEEDGDRALIEERFKLYRPSFGVDRLYDLSVDPREEHALLANTPDLQLVLARLQAEMEEARARPLP